MASFFLGLFLFGFLFTLVTAVMGAHGGGVDGLHGGVDGLHGGADGLHLDIAHGGDTGPLPHGPLHGWLGTLNLSAVMAFVMWFGGAGWLAMTYGGLGVAATVAAAIAAGAFAYSVVAWFFKKLRQGEVTARREDLEGTLAHVTVPAGPGGVGEIVFTLQGVQRVEGARMAGGLPLPKGHEVVITGYERGVCVVQDAQTFINGLPEGVQAHKALPTQEMRPPQVEPERELDH